MSHLRLVPPPKRKPPRRRRWLKAWIRPRRRVRGELLSLAPWDAYRDAPGVSCRRLREALMHGRPDDQLVRAAELDRWQLAAYEQNMQGHV